MPYLVAITAASNSVHISLYGPYHTYTFLLPISATSNMADSDEELIEDLVMTKRRNTGKFPTPIVTFSSSSSSSGSVSKLDGQMAAAVNREWETLVDAAMSRQTATAIKLPWEKGFASKVWGTSQSALQSLPTPRLLQFPALPSDPSSQVNTKESADFEDTLSSIPGAWLAVAKRMSDLKFHQSEDDRRQIALSKWRQILLLSPKHSRLGRRLLTELLAFKSDSYLEQVLKDVFARKATNTLMKRADNLLQYIGFCELIKVDPFPFDEPVFYRFLCEVRAQAAATSCKSSLESVNFSEIIGLDGVSEISESERILGVCHRLQLTKRVTKRSEVLSRQDVVCLERTLMDPECWLPDRVMAGHCLFCLFGRLRWRDSIWIVSAVIDRGLEGGGYLECGTQTSKTSNTAQKKSSILPIVVPLCLLETTDWAGKWIQLREKSGLPDIGSRDDEGYLLPAMPTVLKSGSFTSQPLDSTSAGVWLREIISTGPHKSYSNPKGKTSHGLKSTTLSWVSKHGSLQPYERKILGYHCDQNESSMHIYSRDVIAGPMRKYETVISDVAFGIFDPDASRSGYFPSSSDSKIPKPAPVLSGSLESHEEGISPEEWVLLTGKPEEKAVVSLEEPLGPDQTELEAEDDQVFLVESEHSDKSSQSGSDSCSDSNPDEDILLKDLSPIAVNPRVPDSLPSDSSLPEKRFIHCRLLTMHASHHSLVNKLACGRTLHEGFRLLSGEGPEFPYPKCADCFVKVAGRKVN